MFRTIGNTSHVDSWVCSGDLCFARSLANVITICIMMLSDNVLVIVKNILSMRTIIHSSNLSYLLLSEASRIVDFVVSCRSALLIYVIWCDRVRTVHYICLFAKVQVLSLGNRRAGC